MAGKKTEETISKRKYRHLKGLSGYKEPVRDGHNFSDVDRALTKWLRKNDPTFKAGVISSHFIDSKF